MFAHNHGAAVDSTNIGVLFALISTFIHNRCLYISTKATLEKS